MLPANSTSAKLFILDEDAVRMGSAQRSCESAQARESVFVKLRRYLVIDSQLRSWILSIRSREQRYLTIGSSVSGPSAYRSPYRTRLGQFASSARDQRVHAREDSMKKNSNHRNNDDIRPEYDFASMKRRPRKILRAVPKRHKRCPARARRCSSVSHRGCGQRGVTRHPQHDPCLASQRRTPGSHTSEHKSAGTKSRSRK